MSFDISVCIPVYNTERYLAQCLQSVAEQDFTGSIEIIVLNDASTGRDEKGHTAEKIVKEFKKRFRNKFGMTRYLENSQNLALIETRRRLVNEARGQYIFMLDSDDFLPQGALSSLYEAAVKNDADIADGRCITLDAEGKNHVESINEFCPYTGVLEGKAIFSDGFCNLKFRAIVTSRLIRREIYLRAFEEIPYIRAHMAEEVIQFFFIAMYSKKYVGISLPVYNYRIGHGITTKKIDNLEDWRKVCSTASVITAIYAWIEEQTQINHKCPLDENEMAAIQKMAKGYCINNVKQLRTNVIPEIQDEAHCMLCDYWGEEAIKNTEAFLFDGF